MVIGVEADVFEIVMFAARRECISACRPRAADSTIGFCWPRKIGTNWFMPALVKSRFGASGNSDDEGTIVCCFSRKKSRNVCRICAEVIVLTTANKHEFQKS